MAVAKKTPKRGRLFFLHIEKCGGTSVSDALAKTLCGDQPDNPRVFKLDAKAAWNSVGDDFDSRWQFRDELLSYAMQAKYYWFITGHFRVCSNVLEQKKRGWKLVSLLREPVSRFISHYYYNRYKKQDHGRISVSLSEYLKTPRARSAGASYLGLFTGQPVGKPDQFAIDRAIERMSMFDLVGCLEHMDSFVSKLEPMVGAPIKVPHLNRSPKGASDREAIGEQDLESLRQICAPNIAIYEAALSSFSAKA